MTRLRAILVTMTLLTLACGTQRFPLNAVGTLRAAASRSSSGATAELRGPVDLNGRELVVLTGTIDVHNHRASISTADAHRPARYPPFEDRFVDGWTYVGIDSAVPRPPRLSRSANWVAFQGSRTTQLLPIPDRSVLPGFVFTLLDQLRTQPIADAQFIDQKTYGLTKVRFRLPGVENPAATTTFTVTVDADGRIGEIASAEHFTSGGTAYEQDDDLTLVWGTGTPAIEEPPAAEVQRLAPGEDLYAGSSATTTTTEAPVTVPTLGAISESDAAAGNQALFDSNRTQLEKLLRAQPDPKLTGFSFNLQSNTVNAEFAYAHPAQENRSRYDAFAWQVGQTLSDTFWFPQLVQGLQSQHIDVAFLPKLRIQLDRASYQCPAVVEIAVDARRISEHDWLQKCTT